ncbi:ABC transporter ATP-binding protein [uncultured Jatrophihabitans sp.]|uniref:ABC transporter ATP-binding protein n=1 Tax=uncultured Jatrophihabitans sp. TaxID=1610747 RepID=UPI0035CC9F70
MNRQLQVRTDGAAKAGSTETSVPAAAGGVEDVEKPDGLSHEGNSTGESASSASVPPISPLLELQDLAFGYAAGTPVIDGLHLSLAPGEIVSVVGPSGCGKSSLLRLISGLSRPWRGRITTAYRRPGQHGISMVFQDDTLLPWLRVRDNVALHHRFNGTRRRKDTHEQVNNLLGMVGLSDKAHVYPSQLSGGMRRRVAVLTALAANPELLLLDEPFSALDEPTRVSVHRDLYRLVKDTGASVVLVTHDLGEAISLSDRVVMLSWPPSTVVEDLAIPFGHDRDVAGLRSDPQFLELYAHLWAGMEGQLSSHGSAS